MAQSSKIYCFRASYQRSTQITPQTLPDWISVSVNWQGYRISTNPWIASVAQVLGTLELEDTALGWQVYLESLGFKEVNLVGCEDLFEDTLYC
jgi:hypothetical protein